LEAGSYDPWAESVEEFLSDSQGSDESLEVHRAIERFLAAKKREGCSDNTLRTYKGVLERFANTQGLADAPIGAASRAHCERYIRQKDISCATQRKRYRFLRAWLNWLQEESYLSTNPIDQIKQPKAGRKLPKALHPDELEKLLLEANPWFGRLIRFAVYSGLRPSELARLKWAHVDLDRETITILKQKNNNQSLIPLTKPAKQVLVEKEASGDQGFIFNRDERSVRRFVEYVSKRFRDLRRSCGLREEISMYSTRHTTATVLIEQGVSPVMVKELMRHSEISTTLRYTHVANDKIRDAANDAFAGM